MHDVNNGIVTLTQRETGVRNLHLCHRLDNGTSGCLILAKSPQAAAEIGHLFSSREIQKFYLVLISHKPAKKQGTIAGDMKNRRQGQHILLKTRENPAVTQFFTSSLQPGIRCVIVKPLTGKTHQIRVALKSLSSPILGDSLYGGEKSDRMYLHAWKLQFTYKGEEICCESAPKEGSLFTSPTFQHWLKQQPAPQLLSWPSFNLPRQQDVPE